MIAFAVSAGVCLSSAACFLALGLKRPIDPGHVTFSALMGACALFQLTVGALHAAPSLDQAIELSRWAVVLAIVIVALLWGFVHKYTAVPAPRAVSAALLIASLFFLAYDLATPKGLMFEALADPSETSPTKVSGSFAIVPTGPFHLAWQSFNVGVGFWCGIVALRSARRVRFRQGIGISSGILGVTVSMTVDLIRNALELNWSYVGGYGVTVMAILLTIQLAVDSRNKEIRLTQMLADALRFRDRLNTPLQTLHFTLEVTAAEGTYSVSRLDRLRSAVSALSEFSRGLRRLSEDDPQRDATSRNAVERVPTADPKPNYDTQCHIDT